MLWIYFPPAARVILWKGQEDYITPLLKLPLHSLSIPLRMEFKILTQLNEKAPQDLNSAFHLLSVWPSFSLFSSLFVLLLHSCLRTCALSAPPAGNTLPSNQSHSLTTPRTAPLPSPCFPPPHNRPLEPQHLSALEQWHVHWFTIASLSYLAPCA